MHLIFKKFIIYLSDYYDGGYRGGGGGRGGHYRERRSPSYYKSRSRYERSRSRSYSPRKSLDIF